MNEPNDVFSDCNRTSTYTFYSSFLCLRFVSMVSFYSLYIFRDASIDAIQTWIQEFFNTVPTGKVTDDTM